MIDEKQPKEQLLKEIIKMRQRIAELERSEIELKKAEKNLIESEEMYKTLVKTSPDAVGVCNLDGVYIEASQKAIELLGFKSADEFIGKSYFQIIAPEDQEKVKRVFQKILEEGFIKNIEITLLKKNGTSFIGEANASLIKDVYGKPKAIIGIIREITEHKKAEEALRESEELYRKLVTTSPDIMAVSDLKGIITEVSQQTVELFGYQSADELIGRNGFNFIAPESRERIMKDFQKVIEEGFMRKGEYTALRKDGTLFIIETYGALVRDAYGKPKAVISTSRDITERKKMEKKLKLYSKKLEQMVKERTRKLKMAQQQVKTLRRQIQQSQKYPEIIGKSPKILQVVDLVHQIARTNSTVLIYGETGSGKDLIAKAIHYNSPQKEGSFLTLNCAALPEHLIESELFGYVKGAFTGATQDRKGLFEEANKGTIFLNEISEMPLKVQAKLLQVLENQQIRPLGQSKIITVDVRIIAASNRDLEEAVDNRHFRKDLFYRLNVFPIKVPPLMERREDIPLLVKHFLAKYSASINKHIPEISKEAMDMLCQYNYPGNVRELENIIHRAIIITQDPILLPNHLPDKLRGLISIGARASLAEMEKQIIIDIIHKCKGDFNKAARKLAYSRTTLWRRMKKLNIDWPKFFHK